MEALYIVIAVVVIKLVFVGIKSLFSPNLPEHSKNLSIKELFKLADDYCWGMYPKDRSTKKAKQILEEIIQKGTQKDIDKVKSYAETDCQSIYKDILTFIRVVNSPYV